MRDIWVAVDFDATIAEYDGFKGWDVCGKPIKGALPFLRALKEAGFKVAILSARAMDPKGKKAIELWTQKHAPGLIDMVTHEKRPEFFVMVDDRAVYFDGGNYVDIFKEIIKRMKN